MGYAHLEDFAGGLWFMPKEQDKKWLVTKYQVTTSITKNPTHSPCQYPLLLHFNDN